MYYKTLFLSFLLSLIFCAPALAQNIFVGGSIGNGFNNKNLGDISGEDFKIKESNVAWKVFAAAHWKFLGAEGGYRDFGKIEKTTDLGTGTSRTRGGDAFAKGVVNIGRTFHVFGKAGVFFSRTKNEFTIKDGGEKVVNEKDRETAFAWGFGGGLYLGRIELRAEYENFEISSGNLGMISFGAALGLGRRQERE